jgi:pimeloyl-ACP methyl ester carboxylesterase
LEKLSDLQDEANTDIDFGNIPLTVISSNPTFTNIRLPDSNKYNAYISLREELQKDLLNLSTESTWCYAKKSGHFVHHYQPELVIEQILNLIPAVKLK